MNSKEYWGLAEAYAEVYASEETEQLDEIIRPTTGQLTAPKAAPRTPQPYRPGGGRQSYNQRRSGTGQMPPPATPRTSSTPKPAPTPAAKPAPSPTAKPAPTPTAKPAPTSAAKPAASTPKASPAPTTSSASTAAAAPKRTFNPLMQKTFGYQTGYAPDQVKKDPKKMAQMGSLRSVTSGFDMFDLVKGHLLDEGYADTEEAAIAIMANMSEEWRQSIISEAPGEWFGGLRDKARASRAAQMQSAKPTPKPGPNVSSPFAKPASRTDSGRLTPYGAGGGAAAERSGQTRAQIIKQGAKNLETKNKSNPGPNFGR